jgi:probable 2-oxoglutarate dehydrogenase E1 component DHKTD1
MPHRGRLSLLAGMMRFPLEKLFSKIRGHPEFPVEAKAIGDVVTHFVSTLDFRAGAGSVRVSMVPNPSHLDSINPVSMGRTRALMQLLADGDYSDDVNARWSDKVLNVQVDAAF